RVLLVPNYAEIGKMLYNIDKNYPDAGGNRLYRGEAGLGAREELYAQGNLLQGDRMYFGRYSGSSDVSVIGEETGKALDERQSANLNIRGTTDNPVLFSESLKRAKSSRNANRPI
ncbi:MAG: hypothetical protein RSE43_04675, partial [Oscillospiraceae bacterium]